MSTTVTGHIYRFGSDSFTTFTVDVERDEETGFVRFQRDSGPYLGTIAYMEPTNEHTHRDECRWYVHVTPAGFDRMPWGFYVSQPDMWKLDPFTRTATAA